MCAIFGMVIKEFDRDMIEDFFLRFAHMQHRGQESVGIAYTDGKIVWTEKAMGLIPNLLNPDVKEKLFSRKPVMIMGQTRYSTSGDKSARDIPPQWMDALEGRYAIVHNGNIPELEQHKRPLEEEGVWFNTDLDTEFILKKIIFLERERRRYADSMNLAISEFMRTTGGTFSAALMSKKNIYVFRDQKENRPLFISKSNEHIFFGSETCAFKDLDFEAVDGGDIHTLNLDCSSSVYKQLPNPEHTRKAHCVFEKIYFARPDSLTFSPEIEGMFRFRSGQKLGEVYPVKNADIVIDMPESGRMPAQGYAMTTKTPLVSAFIRDRYSGQIRLFISPPGQRKHHLKYHLQDPFAENKVAVIVDDSIVRGDTLKASIRDLRNAGVKEVHLRIASPKITSPCYYGIDLPTASEIIGSSKTVDQIREFLGADSLRYLDEIYLREVLKNGGEDPKNYCMACFNGDYPIPLEIPL